MPAFIKTPKDEKDWKRAQEAVHKSYPKLKENSDKFWAITNKIFQNINAEQVNGEDLNG